MNELNTDTDEKCICIGIIISGKYLYDYSNG